MDHIHDTGLSLYSDVCHIFLGLYVTGSRNELGILQTFLGLWQKTFGLYCFQSLLINCDVTLLHVIYACIMIWSFCLNQLIVLWCVRILTGTTSHVTSSIVILMKCFNVLFLFLFGNIMVAHPFYNSYYWINTNCYDWCNVR